MREADRDRSGSIEFVEFLQLMRNRANMAETEEQLIEAFNIFDRDSNGLISLQELKQVMKQIGENVTEKECKDIIEAGDSENIGCLSFDDFIRMIIDKQ